MRLKNDSHWSRTQHPSRQINCSHDYSGDSEFRKRFIGEFVYQLIYCLITHCLTYRGLDSFEANLAQQFFEGIVC